MESFKTTIAAHPFLRSLAPPYLEILSECAEAKEFPPGEVIFKEGDVADRFYLILGGRVGLETRLSPSGTLMVQELSGEDVLGWSWLFPPYVWHFQARALEKTSTIAFNGAHLLVACERNREFGFELMKRLSQVLIRRLQAAQKQFVKLSAFKSDV